MLNLSLIVYNSIVIKCNVLSNNIYTYTILIEQCIHLSKVQSCILLCDTPINCYAFYYHLRTRKGYM